MGILSFQKISRAGKKLREGKGTETDGTGEVGWGCAYRRCFGKVMNE